MRILIIGPAARAGGGKTEMTGGNTVDEAAKNKNNDHDLQHGDEKDEADRISYITGNSGVPQQS